jgi:hypothetical protein
LGISILGTERMDLYLSVFRNHLNPVK